MKVVFVIDFLFDISRCLTSKGVRLTLVKLVDIVGKRIRCLLKHYVNI